MFLLQGYSTIYAPFRAFFREKPGAFICPQIAGPLQGSLGTFDRSMEKVALQKVIKEIYPAGVGNNRTTLWREGKAGGQESCDLNSIF